MNDKLCVYCNQTHSIIDYVRPGETPTAALNRLSPTYGERLAVMLIDEACKRSDAACVTEPREITSQQFTDMLNILMPVRWENTGATESFKMSERLSGTVTGTYVRLGDRYFTFYDTITLPHDDCCAKVANSPAYAVTRDENTPAHER